MRITLKRRRDARGQALGQTFPVRAAKPREHVIEQPITRRDTSATLADRDPDTRTLEERKQGERRNLHAGVPS